MLQCLTQTVRVKRRLQTTEFLRVYCANFIITIMLTINSISLDNLVRWKSALQLGYKQSLSFPSQLKVTAFFS